MAEVRKENQDLPPLSAPGLNASVQPSEQSSEATAKLDESSNLQPSEDGKPNAKQDPEPNETIYLSNLNENIKLSTLKQSLRNLFMNFGEVLDVVAHKNLRMRGQAFISFNSKDVARRAVIDVQNFPLYGQPIKASFAKTRSDIVIRKQKGLNELENHKTARLAVKPLQRRENIQRQKKVNKLKAAYLAHKEGIQVPDSTGQIKRDQKQLQMPDEYLPPNAILFIQNLPSGITKERLESLFGQYPNLAEIRLIPTRPDIAFVEYLDEQSSTVAKDALHNYHIDDNKMKVTFARK